MNLFLIIYVDDFKLSGPADKLDRGWKLIEKGLNIDPPNDINGQTYLGCRQERMKVDLPGGGKATVDIKNMEEFMRSCVQLYLDLAPGATLRTVATPFLAEDQRDSPARGPAGTGPVEECPWCCHTFTPNPYSSVSVLEKHRKAQRHAVSASADSKRGVPSGTGGASTAGTGGSGKGSTGGASTANDFPDRGRLAPVAARILMKILYGARCARLDLLRAVSHLACYFTKWTSQCDKRLHQLVCYINSTLHYRMVGWIGDGLTALQPHLFADADFAGCVETQRSTSGLHLAIRGPNSCFPIAGVSKRQTCVSHSTPEAEMVSMDHALRHCGLPCLDLWHRLLPHLPGLVVHEDNQAMIKVVESGRNPTMRYIGRTHGVSVAWLHETFKGEDLALAYEITSRMCADIYTKAFTDADKWKLACWLINICDPKELFQLAKRSKEWEQPPPPSGGTSCHDSNPAQKAGGTTKISGGASAAGSSGVGAIAGDASVASNSTDGNAGGASTASNAGTSMSAGENTTEKPQPVAQAPPLSHKLKELRLGRRFTYKRQHYNNLLSILRTTFKRKLNDDTVSNSGHPGQASSSEIELSDRSKVQCWCSTTSRRFRPQEERFLRALNTIVEDKVRDYEFSWGSVRVTTGNDAHTHFDSTNSGSSLMLLFGEFVGGAFVSGSVDCDDVAYMHVYDGRSSFRSEASVGERFLVEIFLSAGSDAQSTADRQYLTSLGFRLPGGLTGGASAAGDPGTEVASVGSGGSTGGTSAASEPGPVSGCYKALVIQVTGRVLVEGCCEYGLSCNSAQGFLVAARSYLSRRTMTSRRSPACPSACRTS